jgi:GTP-binding protein EngB required for normal cell division
MTTEVQRESTPTLLQQVSDLAVQWDRPDVAAVLTHARSLSADPVATVVVAGETKRGKSRFVNALVSASVCPVDADVASNAYLAVSYGQTPTARVFTEEQPNGMAIELSDIPTWTSELGNPGNIRRVKLAEANVPAPLLASGIRLIDTPGVGGLVAAHRQVTLAALSVADALLFVVDAEAPISRPECDFLTEAAKRVNSVILVLTKADLYSNWEQIFDEDKELLAARDTRFNAIPFVAVSSAEKEDADEAGDPQLADESGFTGVERILRAQIAGRATHLRVMNLALTIRAAIDQLEAPERLTALANDAEQARTLEIARAARAAHIERTKNYSSVLFIEHQRRVANPIQLEFRRRLRAITEYYENRITSDEQDALALPQELDAELRGLACDMRTEIARAAGELLQHLADLYAVAPLAEVAMTIEPTPLPDDFLPYEDGVGSPHRPTRAQSITKTSALMRSALYGRSLAAAMGPVGLLIGVAVGGLGLIGNDWAQRKERSRQAARGLVYKAMETARTEIDADLRARLLDAQQLVQQEVRFSIEQRNAELAEQITRCERAISQDSVDRKADQAEASRRLECIAGLRANADELYRRAEELISQND